MPEEVLIPDKHLRPSYKWNRANTMSFPRELRGVIPEFDPCWGRILVLSSIDGNSRHTLRGRRVSLKFLVQETGKLSGEFPVYADLDVEAARELAATLLKLVEQAEQMPPASTLY